MKLSAPWPVVLQFGMAKPVATGNGCQSKFTPAVIVAETIGANSSKTQSDPLEGQQVMHGGEKLSRDRRLPRAWDQSLHPLGTSGLLSYRA